MGCDIHAFEEWEIAGAWHFAKRHRIVRSYELFARMCGVRAYDDPVTPIAKDRGLPDGMSVVVKAMHDYEDGDCHSESWLTWNEVMTLEDEWAAKYPRSQLFDYPDENVGAKRVTGRRLIVWFDN